MASNIQNVYTDEKRYIVQREQLVSDLEELEGIQEPAVLRALRKVPRHWFVPETERSHAYENRALPLGRGQTISQPYMVARAAELLRLCGDERVLEIGGGSGYQAVVLAEIAREVYAVEQDPELLEGARQVAHQLGCDRVQWMLGDGKNGWASQAPFDRILVSCAATHAEPAWEEQLVPGGFLVFPLHSSDGQWMERWRRGKKGWDNRQKILPVKFVPLL